MDDIKKLKLGEVFEVEGRNFVITGMYISANEPPYLDVETPKDARVETEPPSAVLEETGESALMDHR